MEPSDLMVNEVPYPHDAMVIALQYWEGDQAQAMRLARLIADIEPTRRNDVVLALCRRNDCEPSEDSADTFRHCSAKFPVMVIRSGREGYGHPEGCNQLFAGTMDALADRYATGELQASSVLLMESDHVPLRKDWINVLLAEQGRALAHGKRISGARCDQPVLHVNGGLIMHLSAWLDHHSLATTPKGQAWDIFHRAVLLAECRPTTALRNEYGSRDWSAGTLSALARDCALLLNVKDLSAIEWAEHELRHRIGPVSCEPIQNVVGARVVTDLFLRTYPGDYQWLPYLFNSIERHVRGFRDLVIVTPGVPGDVPPVSFPVKKYQCRPYANDYNGQQITKLRAWEYSDAQQICFIDSDLVFVDDLDLSITWPYPVYCARWDAVGQASCWREPTARILGLDPQFETMRTHPFVYPRSLIKAVYQQVGGEERLLAESHFSEFNLLGTWAIQACHFQHEDVSGTTDQDSKPRKTFVEQFWSHGGITEQVRARLRELGYGVNP